MSRHRNPPPTEGAARLRAIRERLAVNQATLADLLGVYPFTVSRWETGRRKVPPWAFRLCEQLAADMPSDADWKPRYTTWEPT